jgi:hypothetical protein
VCGIALIVSFLPSYLISVIEGWEVRVVGMRIAKSVLTCCPLYYSSVVLCQNRGTYQVIDVDRTCTLPGLC